MSDSDAGKRDNSTARGLHHANGQSSRGQRSTSNEFTRFLPRKDRGKAPATPNAGHTGSSISTAQPGIITTRILIRNIHCSACSSTIYNLLTSLIPRPISVEIEISSQQVVICHYSELSWQTIVQELLDAEFEVDSVSTKSNKGPGEDGELYYASQGQDSRSNNIFWEQAGEFLFQGLVGTRKQSHVEQCNFCKSQRAALTSSNLLNEKSGKHEIPPPPASHVYTPPATIYRPEKERIKSGETSYELNSHPHPTHEVSFLNKRKGIPLVLTRSISSTSFKASSSTSRLAVPRPAARRASSLQYTPTMAPTTEKDVKPPFVKVISDSSVASTSGAEDSQPGISIWEARYSIEGMTCASCSSKIQETLDGIPEIKSAEVNLMGNSATITYEGTKEDAAKYVETVEDLGYDCVLDELVEVNASRHAEAGADFERVASLKIDGMRCPDCPPRIMAALETFGEDIKILSPIKLGTKIVEISYKPRPPFFTIRNIKAAIEDLDSSFKVSVFHPPTMEERARQIQKREQKMILLRLALSFVVAIPTFIIGIVWMMLLPNGHELKTYWLTPIWKGRVSRAEWALLILATPIQFFAADIFHRRALKEIRALWRPGSSVPIARRFYKFGSMNLLVSLGVTIAYIASVALLGRAAVKEPHHMDYENGVHNTTYFDATVFLTFFLLIGKFLEAYSKSKTADAVKALAQLRPTEAQLVVHSDESDSGRNTPNSLEVVIGLKEKSSSYSVHTVNIDFLEAGDVILVANGSAPPADGIVIAGETSFDESSLTGESLPVRKVEGDTVYAGTVNKGKPVQMRIDAVEGNSMLDQIVKVVREGQTKRAPMERVADKITGYFVPIVTAIAIATWIIWTVLGETGVLPADWLDIDDGGWPVWALEFAIAVFVIACPCGIGLAAPTALFVGSGLAAQNGILARGGGEAFQEASWLDCIVFDKTGTLTVGAEPVVTDHKAIDKDETVQKLTNAAAIALEETSSHPLGKAIVNFCEREARTRVRGENIEEVPGRGIKGSFTSEIGASFDAIIGNESFMKENSAEVTEKVVKLLHAWKSQGKSVILVAIRSSDPEKALLSVEFRVTAIYAAADPLREESRDVVASLQKAGIDIWMISGDNPITAAAVARSVGIAPTNVIAGVLPTEKADKIKWLQKTAPKRKKSSIRSFFSKSNKSPHRATVAMVGDGINDAPALTMADVGIAIGSGSDVAIHSAKFILVSSDLRSLLTLTRLSEKVFTRVKFNFFWACVYNICALPVAAGVVYPAGRTRLSPIWAALAMALSSVSVVCSSLLLKTKLPGVGFRPSIKERKK